MCTLDVAVGAPYGDHGGSVFVYLGSGDARRVGRLPGPQRLPSAGDPAATQPGFGISVAGGVDVDGNGYVDVVVGSYMEGRARVFLARPAVSLVASVTGPESLRLADRRTNITACLTYTSHRFQDDVEATMVFSGDGSADSRPVTISKGKTHCENVTWTIKARDKLEPVHVKVRGEIRDKNDGVFCGDCPVADPQRSVGGSVLIPFNTGCRNEARCESDLRLTVDASWQPSVVGQGEALPVELLATVENTPGYDTAHVAGVLLEAAVQPPEAAWSGLHLADTSGADCEVLPAPNASSIALRCNLRMLKMRPGWRETVRLKVALQGQAAGVATLSWNATAFLRGHELRPEDNQRVGALQLYAPAGLALTGGTEPRYISAVSDDRGSYKFTQFFRVINAGAYRLQSFNFSLHLPLALDYEGRQYGGIHYKTPKTSTPNKVTCATSSGSPTSDAPSSQGTPGWISQISTAAFGSELRATADCSKLDRTRCQTFQCVAGPLEADGDSVDVSVAAVLLRRSIEDVLSRADVDVIGRARLHMPQGVLLTSELSSETNTTTTILSPNIQRAALAPWVWIVLVVVALLIYAAIVAVLYKMGFFKRKKPTARRSEAEDENLAEAKKLMEED
ncbi:integrin alpha-IIb-like [Schistocerca cancellata]|uniref:integrin alpha-IIb-like n=1 Tax=Schistocerca cancellata TaxID=274614 RepID=UPI002117312D|nr:integrin alpha-IIb-like [Schistocerca cancellata]